MSRGAEVIMHLLLSILDVAICGKERRTESGKSSDGTPTWWVCQRCNRFRDIDFGNIRQRLLQSTATLPAYSIGC